MRIISDISRALRTVPAVGLAVGPAVGLAVVPAVGLALASALALTPMPASGVSASGVPGSGAPGSRVPEGADPIRGADAGQEIPARPAVRERPNVVVIVVDDLRWDEYGAAGHPFLRTPNIDRLAREGVVFSNAYNVTPLCSPNRASILTGQYVSKHGILDNVARDKASHRLRLFAQDLQKAGYETAHIGKWHMGNDPTPRPGYDYWVSFPGQGKTFDPVLWEDGGLHEVKGYVTDILTDRALSFIRRDRDRPFFLYIGHKAIHPDARQLDDGSVDLSYGMRYLPAPRHLGMYEDAVFPRRPNAKGPPDRSDKPVVRKALDDRDAPPISTTFGEILDRGTSDESIRRRSEMLMAVDEGLGALMAALEEMGELDNTLILFTSDNGYFYGEHGLSIERRLPYEEAARAPFLLRYRPLARPGSVVDEFVTSIDIAPTVLDVAGAPIGPHIQGRSVVPLLRGDTKGWRNSFLIEYISYENPMPWLLDLGYKAVRKGKYKYIHWIHYEGMDELYNLESDPFELHNLYHEPGMEPVIREMQNELGRLVVEAIGLRVGGAGSP
ncbi:MAG: sulfatase [Gemmatimonadota bacterium]